MAKLSDVCFFFSTVLVCIFMAAANTSKEEEKIFVVYMGSIAESDSLDVADVHVELLNQIKGSADSLVHSYKRSFNAFAAKLTPKEAQILAGKEGVVSVFENKENKVHTTRSWDFLGVGIKALRTLEESNMIVGVIDFGIWPESESFKDIFIGSPPSKWKGICQTGEGNFTCNKKVIGARFYRHMGNISAGESLSPRDFAGHGTHTASTAAGNNVGFVDFFGLGAGIARGGVPGARIAVYKACWADNGICQDVDVLAAFDDAVADGVDIISASLGFPHSKGYFDNAVAIGSFHAHQKGVLTCAAAGNDGPGPFSVSNNAPWLVSVAATTIDRRFFTVVNLGEEQSVEGGPFNTFDSGDNKSALVQMPCPTRADDNVNGKVILCKVNNSQNFDADLAVGMLRRGGASGGLLPSLNLPPSKAFFGIPATWLSADAVNTTVKYINSTSDPTASLKKSIQSSDASAPLVAEFSSRGPSPLDFFMLKPDLAAPGFNILAAYSPAAALTSDKQDSRRVTYNMQSGTSMACPHVSATAAYVKSFHPSWSASAIMSALITTAKPMVPEANIGGAFAYGAGNVNPTAAIDPGLVYDLRTIDFIELLCFQGYNSTLLQKITRDNSTCSESSTTTIWNFNYPSFTLFSRQLGKISGNFSRVLTNVGTPGIYKATIKAPFGIQITVQPESLVFSRVGEEKSFELFVNGELSSNFTSGSLIWSDGFHDVRSTILIHSLILPKN